MELNVIAVVACYGPLLFLAAYVIRSALFFLVARKALDSRIRSVSDNQVLIKDSNIARNAVTLISNDADLPFLSLSSSVGKMVPVQNKFEITKPCPYISILIATYNEQTVIDRLLETCNNLTYDKNKFEIIVIDDSNDQTYSLLKAWEKKILNLRVIHRKNRNGWKGGALNLGLSTTNVNSDYALIIDADAVLDPRTLEKFVDRFHQLTLNGIDCEVIQGYAVSSNCIESRRKRYGWVAKAVDFRLALRNMIEFVAKDKLELPVQITGSLFMIRMDALRSVRFSEGLAEDWDLTIDLNLRSGMRLSRWDPTSLCYRNSKLMKDTIYSRKICYDPFISADSSPVCKLLEYFKQRKRVSEGHTRSFRKKVLNILRCKMKLRDKMEFLLLGLQYLRSLAIVSLAAMNIVLLTSNGSYFVVTDNNTKVIITIEAALVFVTGVLNILSLGFCEIIRKYGLRDLFGLLLLESLTIPALVVGSVAGFTRSNGRFYRTEKTM